MATYWILFIAVAVLSYIVQAVFQRKFDKASAVYAGLTGRETAERMLASFNIRDVRVTSTRGQLTDNFNPADKTVNLSEAVYGQNSVAAVAVAAHECGHAVQHAQGYLPVRLRSALVPVVSFASRILSIVLLAPAYDDNGDGIIDRYCNFSDSAALFDWGFDNWSYREVIKSTDIITEVPVAMGDGADRVSVRPSSSIVRLLPNDEDLSLYQKVPTITAAANGKELEAPISAGQVLGEISIVKDGVTVGTSALVASSDVALSRVQYMRSQISDTLHKPVVQWAFWILMLLIFLYAFVVVRYRNRRRAYLKRVSNARIAREIAAADEDVRAWYGEDGEATRPVKPKVSSAGEPRRSAEGRSGVRKPARSAAGKKPAGAPKSGSAKPKGKSPAVSVAKSDPSSPSASEDDSFRDCFEEFFGKKDE